VDAGSKFPLDLSRAAGVTPSERRLKQLCDRSFLSMWSYASVFRDQDSAGGRDGKEICDVLVVFGDHVLIFSDKDCAFPTIPDVGLAWCRWYRRTVADSAKQIFGAERWIKEHPNRLYLDRKCTWPFPIPLPNASVAKFHRIVVAHGSGPACATYFRGGSGSLMIYSDLVGVDATHPFAIGFPDASGRLVHVLDDVTFQLLLRGLDTITDFVEYLARKEALFAAHRFVIATGEEDLLARYLRHVDHRTKKHDFAFPTECDGVAIPEGGWNEFVRSSAALSQQHADRVSYAWDRLIEKLARDSKAQVLAEAVEHNKPGDAEPALRLMASEPRTARRLLAGSLIELINEGKGGRRVRLHNPPRPGRPAYIFMTLWRPEGVSLEDYRRVRLDMLEDHCRVAKLRLPDVRYFVGIATEPKHRGAASEDLITFDSADWTNEDEQQAKSIQAEHGYLTSIVRQGGQVREYPNESVRPPTPMDARRNPRNCSCRCGSGLKYKKCCGKG
jgi:hypothetical protein